MIKYVTGITRTTTPKQASELLQVHTNALRAWDKKGILKAIWIGGRN
ncbi:MAG: hypothetical protein WAQ24_05360 [Candidatus Saccharimonadales bacterium]